ncbi:MULTISPECIES: RNA polymerase sigma factor [Brevibacillus]|jgi:RNA polymerase sigma-70 factor (ECF subfamily)|uniref:RNA polymerase sigma-70 factor, ECF subfamily n=2 Tax=Brevibacillus TaxID=55080 RepID=A0A1I3P9J6_9BACL|nr:MULTISPECIES: sigma-70 family RNA polymerase sigma factor [Brevibacillus]MEC2128601.1 sigma-70 family RNA polymerase sigma factor [Brevibacillus centrosporus]MED1791716.1 sigma-70 family RNA polymerase sigma factor [Brevibacillus nitrificans]MED1949322.1 sigma-70 family RNA polymerase sigma factor [Brevibacillus centrosporus]MED4910929.1 sigma-70 family RNA polymerase sigma factor [Brevibacillus centrosporus]RNB73570.1 sigma-70 family RNA polymerase sigma factor [Brevibacillus centrosporus]
MGMAIERSAQPSAQSNGDFYESRPFTELYDEYFDRVNRYLRCRVQNPWDADDLTTVVFLKALEKFEQYSRTSPFASWIFRIAHNTFVDFVRKNRELPVDQEDLLGAEQDDTWQPERQALTKEEIRLLRDRLDLLSQDQKDVLMLRYFADLKIAQVAEVLGKTESSIKMISYRGLQKLQKMYEKGESE